MMFYRAYSLKLNAYKIYFSSKRTGDDGKKGGFDCLLIPSAGTVNGRGIATKTSSANVKTGGIAGAFCGHVGLLASKSAKTDATALKKTVCCKFYTNKKHTITMWIIF